VGKPDLGCKKDEWVDDAVKDRKGEYLEASVNFVALRKLNLNTGKTYTGRLSITGNHQIYLPTEIQKVSLFSFHFEPSAKSFNSTLIIVLERRWKSISPI